MWDKFVHSIPTVFDLIALTTCIGALGFRLCVLPSATNPLDSKTILINLWRLLAACIAVLVLSSTVLLFTRAAEMSGLPLTAVLPITSTVLFKTHYGRFWLARGAAVSLLIILCWVGRKRLDSRIVPASMLVAATIIALTRSASGHAADAGDLSFSELMDWLHLMAASFWGGGLIAFSAIVLPIAVKPPDQRRMLVAELTYRFSTLAGYALGAILITAVYNGWVRVGSLHALWETTYGQMVIAKILLLLALIILGASNRYISIPLLHYWAGGSVSERGPIHRRLSVPYLNQFGHKSDWVRVARSFMRKVWAEAILAVGVLICTALLLHEVPARHLSHTGHEHTMMDGSTMK
jgi:putative copper export protein